MKVKIAYTVDMEDVPIKMGLDKDSLATLEAIDKARKEMFQADALLEDVSHIVANYGQIVLAQNTPRQETSGPAHDPAFFDNMLEQMSDGS